MPSDDRHDPKHFAALLHRITCELETLPDKPSETPLATLRALWHAAAGTLVSIPRAHAMPLPQLDEAAVIRLHQVIEQRLAGTPLAHITGRSHFLGLDLHASPDALIPRTETELLAQAAIKLAKGMAAEGRVPEVVDLCTGTGNVALAIAAAVPSARIHAADLDSDAVSLARVNARQLGLEAQVSVLQGDLMKPFADTELAGHVNLLTCNPPYISSARVRQMHPEIAAHEPALAFDGGPLGVSLMMRLLAEAPMLLDTGGWLAFEVGLGQAPALKRRLENNPLWDEVNAEHDESGAIRVLLARKAAAR